MIRFIFGFITGVVSIWLYGLYQWYKMTAEEWDELLQDMTVLPRERESSESTN